MRLCGMRILCSVNEEVDNFMSNSELLEIDILEVSSSENSAEEHVIAGYIVKKIMDKLKYEKCASLMIEDSVKTNQRNGYLDLLSYGGLIKPFGPTTELATNSLSLLDFLQSFTKSTTVRKVCQATLDKYASRPVFSCEAHEDHGQKVAIKTSDYKYFLQQQAEVRWSHKEGCSENFLRGDKEQRIKLHK